MDLYLIVGAVIILIIFVALYLKFGRAPANTTVTPSGGGGPTYTQTNTSSWVDPTDALACPQGTTTLLDGVCVVPAASAESLCNLSDTCIGYITPGSNVGNWASVPAGSSQLISMPLSVVNNGTDPIINALYLKNPSTPSTPAS